VPGPVSGRTVSKKLFETVRPETGPGTFWYGRTVSKKLFETVRPETGPGTFWYFFLPRLTCLQYK